MNISGLGVICISVLSLLVGAGSVLAQQEWTDISDPVAVSDLVRGKALAGGKLWQGFYRQDGNLVLIHFPDRNISFRKWTIDESGQVCEAVFAKPDKIIECGRFQRSAQEPIEYRQLLPTGSYIFTIMETPPEELVEALIEKAGPVE